MFFKTWQYIGDVSSIKLQNHVVPLSPLDNYLEVPMILSRDNEEELHCLSNVCTHRGNLMINKSGSAKKYHVAI